MGQLSTLLKNIWNSLHFVVYKIFRPGSVDKNHLTYIDKVRQDWRARGFSCDLWTDPPGQVWNNFVHPTDELVIVLEGEMEFELEGKKNHPKMHEEVLVPAYTPHSARNLGKTPAHYLYGLRR
ncbi:MAG: cupin domain-containing protein [Nitrospina sp.]|jgi:mannose-6-phosphate isomerase-like protein (cupin superfamily)|nr:cupin domain-containing protein [Nitrospina sp.]